MPNNFYLWGLDIERKKYYYLIWQKPEEFLKLFQNWRIASFPLVPVRGWVPLAPRVSAALVWLSSLAFLQTLCASQDLTALPCSNPQYLRDNLLICWFESAFSAAWLEWSIAGCGLKCGISTEVLVRFKCLPTSKCFSHTLITHSYQYVLDVVAVIIF